MLIPDGRKLLLSSCVFALLAALGTGLAGVAAKSATDAPAGFNTPSFNGAHSISNGIVEPAGDTFARDQQVYEQNKAVADGLGPAYNAQSCVSCHQNPNSGGASQFTELRVGHNDENGNFVNPTIFINDGKNTITGRSIVNDRAIGPEAQEHIPATENIRALRAALNTLGDGFVEAIDDRTLIAIAEEQPELTDGRVHGEVVQAPIFEAPGQTRVGRFGWKDQHSSLLSFIGDAYFNEMGITNRLRPKDATTVLKTTQDPEAAGHNPVVCGGASGKELTAQLIEASIERFFVPGTITNRLSPLRWNAGQKRRCASRRIDGIVQIGRIDERGRWCAPRIGNIQSVGGSFHGQSRHQRRVGFCELCSIGSNLAGRRIDRTDRVVGSGACT
jgi:Di-haem oxidoreductase, putative peroxidase